jgi:hypothetical protein
MAPLSVPQATELFHIAFLDVLSKRLEADRYVLKGGTNLRYFFDSVRYSQDVDLDVEGVPVWRLNEKIEALLSSAQIVLLLRRRPLKSGALDSGVLTAAADLAMQLPYAAFRDQVLPFLEPEAVELYEGKSSWEQMQTFVAEQLEGAR